MIDQVLMNPGGWDLQLVADTPRSVRDLITPYSHIVVLPEPLQDSTSDALLLGAARYVGMVRQPGPYYKIGGIGLEGWLGDENGNLDVLTTAKAHTAGSLATWVADVANSRLNAGTVTSPGGTLTASFQYVTRRQALDVICQSFGVEYRVNMDLTVDVATQANLYAATPTAVAVKGPGGRDLTITGIDSTLEVSDNYDDYASLMLVVGPNGAGTSGGAATYRDAIGNLVTIVKVYESSDAQAGTEATIAANLLAYYTLHRRREIRLTTSLYDITGDVQVGDNLYVYDPNVGLVDTANPVLYRGGTIWPVTVRVLGVRWPITRGMGVYLRTHNGSSATHTDLTPWVQWEDGDTELLVGAQPASITSGAQAPSHAQYTAGAWATYTPSWTGSGGNPAIVDGSITGSYRRDGSSLQFNGFISMGASTTYGAGTWSVSIPSGTSARGQAIAAWGYDSSAGQNKRFVGIVGNGATTVTFAANDTNLVGPTAPMTWAANDQLCWSGTIEVQP